MTESATIADEVDHVRRRWPKALVVGVTIENANAMVAMLEAGADYVAMRGTPEAIVRRIVGSIVRRVRVANDELRVAFGDVVYEREARRVWCAGQEVDLTPRELSMFDLLFLRAGLWVSADELRSHVWFPGASLASNAVAVYIGYVRRKLRGSRQVQVETRRGTGYRLANLTSQAPSHVVTAGETAAV